jgi:hypothetical protein
MASIGFLRTLALLELNLVAGKEEGGIKNNNEVFVEYRTTPCITLLVGPNSSRSFGAGRVTSQINFFALEIVWQRACQCHMRRILWP